MSSHAPHLSRRRLLIGSTLIALLPRAAWPDSPATPEALVAELIDAMAQNDGARIAAVFSDDAEQAYGNGPTRAGDAFRAWLQSDIIGAKGRLDEGATLSVDGSSVIATGRYRNDNGYSSEADFLFVVENLKIIRWIVR